MWVRTAGLARTAATPYGIAIACPAASIAAILATMCQGCPDRSRSLDDAHESDRGALAGDDVEAVGGVQERIGGDLLLDSDDPLHVRSPCSCGQVRRPPSTDSVVPVT
ncbi:hypothetical protein [Streptomyces asiaticus]